MIRFLNGLFFGLIIGAVATWYYLKQYHPQQPDMMESPAHREAAQAVDDAGQAAHHLSEAIKAKLDSLDLHTDQITNDLAHTGKVIRRKAREVTGQVVDATTDARITATIKAKLAFDKELSARTISVTTDQGHVTLSGTVSSPEQIAKAILIAMEPDGVQDVTAALTIQAAN